MVLSFGNSLLAVSKGGCVVLTRYAMYMGIVTIVGFCLFPILIGLRVLDKKRAETSALPV